MRDQDDREEDEGAEDEGADGLDDGRNPDGCCLGATCLNPHPHHLAYECFDVEMAEAGYDVDPAEVARQRRAVAHGTGNATDELKRKAAAGDPAAVRELITTVDQLETQVLELQEEIAVERDERHYRAGVHPRGIA